MIWKPKEKELTEEEAIAQAKKDLAPYWVGSPPRVAGIRAPDGRYYAVPLDPEFRKKPWLILFVDPTDFAGEAALVYATEWWRRYNFLQLGILAIFIQTYQFFHSAETVRSLIERFRVDYPLVLDHDGALAQAFGATPLPAAILMNQGRFFFRHLGKDWFKGTEKALQEFLRTIDQGVSLLPSFDPDHRGEESTLIARELLVSKTAKDVGRMELGFAPKIGQEATFQPPGFQFPQSPSQITQVLPQVLLAQYGLKKEGRQDAMARYESKQRNKAAAAEKGPQLKLGIQFGGNLTSKKNSVEADNLVVMSGPWVQDGERIMTWDSEAWLRFKSQGRRVSVVVQSMIKNDVGTILCELSGSSIYEDILGAQLNLEETGEAMLRVSKPQLYHILVDLPENLREVTLRFVNAGTTPIGVYGIRFGD